MSNSSIDYQSVLKDLKARRDLLNGAIEAIEHIAEGLRATPPTMTVVPIVAGGSDIYRRMTIKDAAIHFLQSSGSKQLTADIAQAIRQGGVRSKSKNMYTTLYNTLSVEAQRDNGKVVRVGKTWELRERAEQS